MIATATAEHTLVNAFMGRKIVQDLKNAKNTPVVCRWRDDGFATVASL